MKIRDRRAKGKKNSITDFREERIMNPPHPPVARCPDVDMTKNRVTNRTRRKSYFHTRNGPPIDRVRIFFLFFVYE